MTSPLAHGAYDTYQTSNLRYSQMAPLTMWDEVNTASNLPAEIKISAIDGDAYKFLFMAKGGGSANKSYLFQETRAILNPSGLKAFLDDKLRLLGTSACPPYHLGLVIGGAVGNVLDRIRFGAVVDFLDFTGLYFPWVFNVADAGINVGAGLLLLDFLLHGDKKPAPKAVADAKIVSPRIPVISNVDAEPHSDPAEIRQLLVRQLVSPVQWEESMRRLLSQHGVERAYEIGPGRVLTGLMKRIDRKFPCENVAA